MKNIKKALLILMSAVLMFEYCGCGIIDFGIDDTETSRTVIYKERAEIEEDVKTYLSNKYGKEFTVAVTDSPNHIYSSYAVTAYDEEMNSFDVSITYYDEENYGVTDDYFMYSIREDLESWFTELADPYISSDFKVFYLSSGSLPSDYSECKTIDEFLKMSPTGTYYGLRFLIMLPASEYKTDIRELVDNITHRMLELKIRGQITAIVYEEADIYEKTLTQKDESFFFQRHFRHRLCTSTLKSDFSLHTNDKILEYGISGYREELDDYVGGK